MNQRPLSLRALALAAFVCAVVGVVVVLLVASQANGDPRPQRVASASLAGWSRHVSLTTTTSTTIPPTTTTRPSPPVTTRHASSGHHTAPPAVQGSGHCGGDLPPCWVMNRESGGNLNAYNPTGCSGRGCYGKWQCDPRTCSGHGTEAQQDAEARALWDNGKGCSNWNAC